MEYVSLFLSNNYHDIISSLFFFTMTIILHFFVRDKIHKKAKKLKINHNGPLYDIFHNIYDGCGKYGKHTDYLLRYMLSSFLILCTILHRLDILLHMVKIYSVLKNLRTLSMCVTILPDISGKGKNTWLNGGTNDLFFSGHVMLSTLLERYYSTYFINDELCIIPWIVNLMIMINTVLTKRHYTIDVIYAWYVTFTLFELSDRIFEKPIPTHFQDYNFF